ncbi:sensor histidine kinase [Steroidobacter cummioxidans]|uniref:sensor histidine kinase n=1 Tax=Steroidobacter cummioxidans TaxID=1803913 RepID=UPI000E324F23|nr:ATP-binding protein [Steroidobacter cummioxidans]
MTDGNWQRVAGRTHQRGFIDGALPMLVKRAVVAQAVLILAALWSYATWRVYSDKAETLEAARHELRALASGMYVHLQAVLNDSLGAARTAALAIDANGGVSEIQPTMAAQFLARELSSGEYVRALFVMTPNRFVSAVRNRDTQVLDTPPQWIQPAIDETRSFFIGRTIEDPIASEQRAFPIAVRTVDSTGATVWAGALLGVDALDQLYETMAIRGGALSVTSTAGDLLLRVPTPAVAYKGHINVRNTDVYRGGVELSPEGGFVEAPSPFASGTWVYAIRRLGGYGLAVSASREKEAILQQWHDRTRGLTIVLVGISVLFLALTALLRHFVNRLEKANTNLGQLNAELESRVAARTNELQEANQQLALTNEELEAFTASASHDLRSPLGTIAGQAGLLRDDLGGVMTEVITQRIDRIQTNVTRSSEIIDGLLSLARVSRQELLNERVDISALARNIVEDLRQQYPRHKVECVIEPNLVVNADPRLMKSLFGNLLGNAWKYTSRIPNARVEVSCRQATGGIVFAVRDNGAGFDMSRSQRLFEPFQRLHSPSEFPGVGIGLAIVARIVRRYGGKVTVDSEQGRGTIFRFTLPAAAVTNKE